MNAPDLSRLAPGHFRRLRPSLYPPPPASRRPVRLPVEAAAPAAAAAAVAPAVRGLTFSLASDAVYGLTCAPLLPSPARRTAQGARKGGAAALSGAHAGLRAGSPPGSSTATRPGDSAGALPMARILGAAGAGGGSGAVHAAHTTPLVTASAAQGAGLADEVQADRAALVELCAQPVLHRLLELAQRRLVLQGFEARLENEYRQTHPYAGPPEMARAVYGDPRYEQTVNRLKFADSAQCARMLAARIARDTPALAVRTAVAEGFAGEFVLVAAQMDEDITDWHALPHDTVLMDPWGQRQGPARGLLIAAGLASSQLAIQRVFT